MKPTRKKTSKFPESPHAHYKNIADETVTLQLFNIIEHNPKISQRKITLRTGLATGLVHSYMRRVIAKGWIKAKQVSAKRWLYYLTPEGFYEKSRLTMKYLTVTMRVYRLATRIIQDQIKLCTLNNWRRHVIVGENELAEITALNLLASGEFKLVAVSSVNKKGDTLAGTPAVPFEEVQNLEFDKLWICDFNNLFKEQKIKVPEERIVNIADLVMNFSESP